jgi:hypothetical protein
LRLFTVDPAPLSIAFVIDQSLTSDVMAKVNNSLGAIQGALTPYDEVAVFSYNNGSQERTGFTGAQSNRLPAVLALTKETGSEMLVPVNSGPMAGCNIRQNGNCVDPNLQPGRSAGGGSFITIPKEIHTLNDAILSAAKELSTRPKGRRRIIYVISDGKEYGSKATLRGGAALPGDQQDRRLRHGGGHLRPLGRGLRKPPPPALHHVRQHSLQVHRGHRRHAGLRARNLNGIEKSYAKIAEEARTQYTLGYLSHESIYDSKFRSIDVRVDRPGVEVIAKRGYYPSAQDTH